MWIEEVIKEYKDYLEKDEVYNFYDNFYNDMAIEGVTFEERLTNAGEITQYFLDQCKMSYWSK